MTLKFRNPARCARLLMTALALTTIAPDIIANSVNDGISAYRRGDFETAERLLQAAGRKGDVNAALLLGNIAQQSNGSQADLEAAAKWYQKAAHGGLATAQSKLAACYIGGAGVKQSEGEALKWYRRAAIHGDIQAAASLAYLYQLGNEVEHDPAKAAYWYRVAARRGDLLSANILGDFYSAGFGVSRNDRTAAKWYRLAAKQGDPEAQYRTAVAYYEHVGVARDPVAALAWVTLALRKFGEHDSMREPATRLASAIAGELTAAQAEQAQQWADAWHLPAGSRQIYDAPDDTLQAVVTVLGRSGESRIDIRERGNILVSRNFASSDGQHGYAVQQAQWTPNSRYFVFSLSNSGGHQPWHFPTYVYSRRTNKLLSIDNQGEPVASPEFHLDNDDILKITVLQKDGINRQIEMNLQDISSRPN